MRKIACAILITSDDISGEKDILDQIHEINSVKNVSKIFLSTSDSNNDDIFHFWQAHRIELLNRNSFLYSIKLAKRQGFNVLLRIYYPGYVLRKDVLNRLLQYHFTEKKDMTVFKPTVPHVGRSPFQIAEIINIDDFSILWVYRQKIVHKLITFIKKVNQSIKLRYIIKKRSAKLRVGKYLLSIKKYMENLSSVDPYLEVFVGKDGKSFRANDQYLLDPISKKIATYSGTLHDAEYFLIDHILDYIPLAETIYVVSSNVCNLRCIMCTIWSHKYPHATDYYKKKRFMSLELFKKIATEAAKTGSTIRIGMVEEPLLNYEIVNFVRFAKEIGVPKIGITTNATLLQRDIAERLIKAGLDIMCISLDAATSETYKKIRGGEYSTVVSNIHGLLELKKNLRSFTPDLDMIIIDQEPATSEIEQFIRQWLPQVNSVAVNKLTIAVNGVDVLYKPNEKDNCKIRTPCISPWKEIVVLPEGEVLSCCVSALNLARTGLFSLGNLYQQSLPEIWSGRPYTLLRKNVLYNKFDQHSPHCGNCQYWVNNDEIAKHRFEKGVHIIENKWFTLYKNI